MDSGGKSAGKKPRTAVPAVPGGAGYSSGGRLNLNPGAAKGPNPRGRLRFQGHDVLLQGVGNNISELFQIKAHISNRPE